MRAKWILILIAIAWVAKVWLSRPQREPQVAWFAAVTEVTSVETATTGVGVKSSKDRLVETVAAPGARDVAPISARVNLTEESAWLYRPLPGRELAPLDARYDQEILAEAKENRDATNPWRESSFKSFQVADVFQGAVHPLKNPREAIALILKLRRKSPEPLTPQWIRAVDASGAEVEFDYNGFTTKYVESNPYIGTLSFPYDAFWRRIDPEAECEEIALIYDTLGGNGTSPWITGFTGRVFCRNGLNDLVGIGQFSAKIER